MIEAYRDGGKEIFLRTEMMMNSTDHSLSKHPSWLIRKSPDENSIRKMERMLKQAGLSTVCQGAHCPNLGECFNRGTATFMILGKTCSRTCAFCAVDKGVPELVDVLEPDRVAKAVSDLGLRYAVVTSVTRDDLPGGGSGHFAETIGKIKALCPETEVEVLVPDFRGSNMAIKTVMDARPDMFNHNVETVPRLYSSVRPQAEYRRSLDVLESASLCGGRVKSGLMLGMGEEALEVSRVLEDLFACGCRYLTIGQYLAPSAKHFPVSRYVHPEEFLQWKKRAYNMGFTGVMAGPLVRSSYMADNICMKRSIR